MPSSRAVNDAQRQELLRGALVIACLRALTTPEYGYGLVETLRSAGVATEGNTVYPLLRRLESQGLLSSSWDETSSRPRKFYETTASGRVVAEALWMEFESIHRALISLDQKVRPR
jgi:PadR family transcriptional regulator PadR